MSMETKLQRLAAQIVSDPSRPDAVLSSLEEISKLMEPFDAVKNLDHPPMHIEALISAVRAQLVRVHLLLESALAYHSGALLAESPDGAQANGTYTPEGKWLTAAAGANLNLQA